MAESAPKQWPAWPVPADLTAKSFNEASIALFDLFRASASNGEAIIRGRTFRNCRLEGPAVAVIAGGCSFDAVDFGYASGDIRNLVIRSANPGKLIGGIPFQDCVFENCMFFAVGFAGPEPFLQQLLALRTPQ
ncbi:hypothetical protein [Caulobacter mirabilis]|uniref:Uncharacterized protein n=1 Tax=Caulobacter mirabilis TaxID=69666 RepID=A0A2D2B167_9CAUL|nr:hypothetical protein [Caulobacter mirabilis]ATQ43982.1 hypothetical protein CSW64_17105 [Caulobacter mirabilis]